MTNRHITSTVETQTQACQLWFTGINQVEVRKQLLTTLNSGEVLVQVDCSAISAGTEMLVYRGHIPANMSLDATISTLQDQANYPLQYGYACVGRIKQVGSDVDASWLGKRIFAFQPHASHFITTPANLIPIPDDISSEDALFLANMETAVNLVQDSNPALGERVVVLGQGIVGLLLVNLLARFPLAQLNAVDAIALRRQSALQLGAQRVFDPFSTTDIRELKQQLHVALYISSDISTDTSLAGADLVYEVSGVPEALNLAIELSGFSSRIVIGSWYGNKTSAIALGGEAHRNRLRITTSQVSSIAPELSGRWDKSRRFELTWTMIRALRPSQLITHRAELNDAHALYQRLHQTPDEILQAIFHYPEY